MTHKLKVAIAGASGYTGGELLRLLYNHPEVEIVAVTSEKSAGSPLVQTFPNLKKFFNLNLEPLDPLKISEKADFIFTALPHGTSIGPVGEFIKMGKKVVDLSADFRIKDPAIYKEWYGAENTNKALLDTGVYGLPELYRDKIKKTSFVANPGCYPTASILAIAPLLKNKIIVNERIFIDAKSSISGAGRGPALPYHFPEAHEGMEAYKVGTHRHTPEIEQALSDVAGTSLKICFVPHIIPANRGMLCTIYAPLALQVTVDDIINIYKKFYSEETALSLRLTKADENSLPFKGRVMVGMGLSSGEPFIRILDNGTQPNIRNVKGSNFCDIGIAVDTRTGCVIVTSVIDNLVKGASGQAIQNMNIMMGFEETSGLMNPGMFP
ncbi:MAG: N-acetyl-gamma-glutamyl-phosphate reductase [Nitrospirae bacterium]|nr:N-acetyl-gamma-glutamyl-phosphate reductase [Nitrospirota bacterium]